MTRGSSSMGLVWLHPLIETLSSGMPPEKKERRSNTGNRCGPRGGGDGGLVSEVLCFRLWVMLLVVVAVHSLGVLWTQMKENVSRMYVKNDGV